MGKYLKGIWIDLGDLVYLFKKVCVLLDEVGLIEIKIIVLNLLDEFIIRDLIVY